MSDAGVRVYLPLTFEGLAGLTRDGSLGPAPLRVHAVTDALRRAWDEADEEELEYAAMAAAARESVALDSGKDLRVVVALDVPAVEDLHDPEDPTAAQVVHEVPRRRVAAVHVDTGDAEPAVARARAARGTDGYDDALEECDRHELAWYATQEIGALLDR